MTAQKKLIWSEGMFIRPQHFQQFERYLEGFVHDRSVTQQGYYWGFKSLQIDHDALSLGKVVITRAEGVLPDGTPFTLPDHMTEPPVLDFPEGLRNERVVLALPLRRLGSADVVFEETADSLARYLAIDATIADSNAIGAAPEELQLGDMRLRLLPQSELKGAWVGIGCVHVMERRADGKLILDENYIPPTLVSGEEASLAGFVRELQGLLSQRGNAIAARLQQPGRGGIGEVGDFLMLALINRFEPVFKHFSESGKLHPERLFSVMLSLAGDLSTFSRDDRRPASYQHYDHDDLETSFRSLMMELRRSLSIVLEQHAIQIELQERKYGVRVAMIQDMSLLRSASFVLAVHAEASSEIVRSRFPMQVKIGPIDMIRDLVNLHLPGVTLRALPIAPRQLPYNAGYNYFELDTEADLWRKVNGPNGLAMHIAGDFPGLSMEFWAIRR